MYNQDICVLKSSQLTFNKHKTQLLGAAVHGCIKWWPNGHWPQTEGNNVCYRRPKKNFGYSDPELKAQSYDSLLSQISVTAA